MFEIVVKVNGSMIGHVYGQNLTGEELSTYYFDYYQPMKGLVHGEVKHLRADGIEKLIIKIMDRVRKERG